MSTIILWNDENKRYEKWVVKEDGIDINIIGEKKNEQRN